ncbi:Uncharacterized protein TCM_027177 [Theobroma cacao]|uniref:Uncharacterized protein n=1 Tax=Theobroma cacao TaxID=3641 RepID=A0A061G9I0_THECC|nr:Uncharacterized protein TCM_027177 [Theobroma cacao]
MSKITTLYKLLFFIFNFLSFFKKNLTFFCHQIHSEQACSLLMELPRSSRSLRKGPSLMLKIGLDLKLQIVPNLEFQITPGLALFGMDECQIWP